MSIDEAMLFISGQESSYLALIFWSHSLFPSKSYRFLSQGSHENSEEQNSDFPNIRSEATSDWFILEMEK